MRKFLAVVKREYIQRVRTKFFVVATILGPVMMAAFTVVPALMFTIKAGGPTRLAIVDQTGKLYERVAKNLVSGKDQRGRNETPQPPMQPPVGPDASKQQINHAGKMIKGSFVVEEARLDNRSLDDVKKELEASRVMDRWVEVSNRP